MTTYAVASALASRQLLACEPDGTDRYRRSAQVEAKA